jgi:hypothetical protein
MIPPQRKAQDELLKEAALRLEREEFFKEFPWKILELLKTADELIIDYTIKEESENGQTIIMFYKYGDSKRESINFFSNEIKSFAAAHHDLDWQISNIESVFDSVRRERAELERKQKLKKEALSKLSKDEKEALGL